MGLERSPPPKTHYIKMGLKQLLPILALAASCHGAALPEAENFDMDTVMDLVQEFIANPDPYMEAFGVRAKRHVEDLNRSGFKQFPIPFIGAEVGIKYKDPSNRDKGGEAYLEILDLASLVPRARSRKVQLHAKFDGGASNSDGLFTMEVDYHFGHKGGSGTEEGSLKVVREKRGGMWHTDIKTEAHPFSGRPIIPARINNMEFEVESDRQTKLKGKYVNANMGRDITWDIVRQPGKNIKAVITRGGVTSTIEGTLNRSGQDMDIIVKADIRGVKYDGKVSLKSAADKTKVEVQIKKGSESVLQMTSEVQIKGSKFRLRSKYTIMGGKVAQGEFSAKYQNNKLTFEAAPYKLDVELHLGRSIKVEAFNGGQSMWTYETLREDKSSPAAIQWEANSKMTLNPASKLYKFIQENYPFGAFQTRTNNFKLFIDRNNRNFLLRKFKINFDVVKDGQKVVDISGNTVDSPYQFSVSAPNLFERLNIRQKVPKSDKQRKRLQQASEKIMLLNRLDQEQLQTILDAMEERNVTEGDVVIQQGDDGDNFYIIEKGNYDIVIGGNRVGAYEGTGSFGELALMYNTPRAATITATTKGTLWSLDRQTFRQIIVKANAIKRKQYEEFLAKSTFWKILVISNVVKLQMLWSRKNLKKMTSLLNRVTQLTLLPLSTS